MTHGTPMVVVEYDYPYGSSAWIPAKGGSNGSSHGLYGKASVHTVVRKDLIMIMLGHSYLAQSS